MREILFRGNRVDNGEWFYGVPTIDSRGQTVIVENVFDFAEYNCRGASCLYVDENTIGQYTGLTDKNGKKIFEGDIFKPFDDEICYVAWIEHFSHLGLMVYTTITEKKRGKENVYVSSGWSFLFDYDLNEREVIGNVHDNPELLKEGDDNG